MTGWKTLLIAAALGVAGVFLNVLYLSQKGQETEMVKFIGIGRIIDQGEKFSRENLVEVEIPRRNVSEQLKQTLVPFSDFKTVEGLPAFHRHLSGDLLFRQDLKTPPKEAPLGEDEKKMGIPVDTRTFVPSLVNPGDQVWFLVGNVPTPVTTESEDPDGTAPPPTPVPRTGKQDSSELIGPFTILSLGNRLGSSDVMKSAGIPQVQENVINIAVNTRGGKLDVKATKLWNLLQLNSFRQVGVVTAPAPKK